MLKAIGLCCACAGVTKATLAMARIARKILTRTRPAGDKAPRADLVGGDGLEPPTLSV
jgi:hypothetical protein